ncbi:TonB-dependent receptor [uncultured Algoriphagus sp.]|uniref:SusC/RagA family TonB-linked outer membrane protein n=1 Tax=uncultured Algoriphagus sp. TaxID=417365 RepID=UPI0030EE5ADB|tara:strand:- start:34989 stop:38240 length:3252 start_codon:yes stop_codon:yes gene_type:complete
MKKLLHCSFVAMCFLLIHFQVSAQTVQVSGTVTSAEDGLTLPGASILVKGTTKGVTSDIDGTYQIDAEKGQTLVFSFIGMVSQERTINESGTINIILEPDAQSLDEVVVVGYGTQKRSDLTGAVSSVDTKVLESRPITDVARGLQGTTPGLTITTPSGQIGQNPTIRLRGSVGTLSNSGGAQPLILVDNVEIPNLQLVNPEDIESISVLKDAASSSIYGARGAWGVILITTKKGKKGEAPKINYSNNFAWATPTVTPSIANAADGAEMAFKALQRTNPSTNVFGVVGMYFDELSIQKMRDWEAQYGGQDLGNDMVLGRDFEIRDGRLFFYRPWEAGDMFMKDWTPQQKHDLSVAGGTEKTTYRLGVGYLGQNGVLKVNPDEFNRYSMDLSLSTQATDWMEVRGGVLYSNTKFTRPFYFSSETYDPWYYLLRWPKTYPYGTYDGHPFRSAVTEVQQAKMNEENTSLTRLNLGTTITPIEGLSIVANYTFDSQNYHDHQTGGVVSAYNFWSTGANLQYAPYTSASYNRVQYASSWSNRNVGKAFATYEKMLGDHSLKVMVGGDIEAYEYWYHSSQRRDLMDLDRGELDLASGDQFVDGARNQWSTAGGFSRINYNYKGKYFLELNGRYDGSSRLSPTERWAFFPSMSAGYVVSEESFFEPVTNVMSFLKLRASWGAIGNQNAYLSDIYRIMNSYSSGWLLGANNQLTFGTPGALPSSLTWETVTTLDLGFDARFFKDKFGIAFDWYNRTTSDMHSAGEVLPASYGTSATKQNFGELETKGWELALDYNHGFSNGLNLNATVVLSDYRETVTEFADNKSIYSNRPGRVIGDIWGYETDRLFTEDDFVKDANGEFVLDNGKYVMNEGIPSQELYESGWFYYGPGDVKYKDLDGDGAITFGENTEENHGDLKVIGNSTPRYQYGVRLGMDFKGIDLSFFVQGVGKRDYWANGPIMIPGYRPGEAWFSHQLDYWSPENPDAFYPRPTDAGQSNNSRNFLPQTRYLLDLSYVRMKNITLGYSLPTSLLSKISLDKVRLYVSGENLFEIDNLDLPLDPEVDYTSAGNNDSNTFGRVYPYSRTLSFGLQVTF